MTPQKEFESFLRKYTPDVARTMRAALVKVRRLTPGAIEMVYDNYNFLVVGFSPSQRPSDAILSLAAAPRHVALCFLQAMKAPRLPDPHGLLRGSGNLVRNIRLEDASTLDKPAVRRLIAAALKKATVKLDPAQRRRMIIKSVSKKQRPRKPRAPAAGGRRAGSAARKR